MFKLLAEYLFVGQRTGWAGNHALSARNAGRTAHREISIEGDRRGVPLALACNHEVVANLRTSPDAAIAQDAGGVIHHDAERRFVLLMRGRQPLGKAWCADTVALGERLQFAITRLLFASAGRWVIGHQQLD